MGEEEGGAPLSMPLRLTHSVWRGVRAEAAAQVRRWFLWSPVAFGGGCAVYFALMQEPPLWLGAVLALVALLLSTAARRLRWPRAWAAGAALLAFLACGFLAAELRTSAVRGPVVWDRTTTGVDGWVVDVAGPGAGGGRLIIAPRDIGGLDRSELPARVRLTVGPTGLVGPGAFVRLRAVVGPPPPPASPGAYDFARDAFFNRIGGVGFALTQPQIVQGPRPPPLLGLAMAVNAARWSLARRMVDDLGPREGGVAVAMTTGHEAWLNPDDVNAMRNAGLTHILSISGVHMAIVGGFIFLLMRTLIALWPWLALRVPGKKVAAGAALAAIAGYLILSGAPAPAVRSAVTLSVAFAAILADRRAVTLHALAVAALIVLAMQPEAVVQPGFQMSFAATAALVAMAELWPRPVREINTPWPIRLVQGLGSWLAAGIGVSVVAGLATGPFAIQHFNRVAAYGLPANLVMEPLSTFLIMPFLAGGAIVEALGGGGWLLAPAGAGIDMLLDLARNVAAWPKAVWVVSSAPEIALPIAFLGLLWVCLWKGRARWIGLPFALAVSLWPRPAPPLAWIGADGGQAAIVDHAAAVILRPGMKAFATDLWSRRRGLTEPSEEAAPAVLASHFDCTTRRCLPVAGDSPRIAAWWTRFPAKPAEVAQACAVADILILKGDADLPPGCTRPRVLRPADFERGGSVEIYAANDGDTRWVWANDLRGARPWTQRP